MLINDCFGAYRPVRGVIATRKTTFHLRHIALSDHSKKPGRGNDNNSQHQMRHHFGCPFYANVSPTLIILEAAINPFNTASLTKPFAGGRIHISLFMPAVWFHVLMQIQQAEHLHKLALFFR